MVREDYVAMATDVAAALAQDDKPAVVQLTSFFEDAEYEALKKKVAALALKQHTDPMHAQYHESAEAADFLNGATLDFISSVTKTTKKLSGTVIQLKHRDFTLLHDDHKTKSKCNIIIDFTEKWHADWGGLLYYIDGSGDFRMVPPAPNSLCIVSKDLKTHHFIKYVNNKAGDNVRTIFIGALD